jgi:rhodanese-related sulfurtransferase
MRTLLIVSVLLLLAAATCFGQVKNAAYRSMLRTLLSHSVPEVTVPQVAADSAALLLDAREPQEFAVSHLAQAREVGYDHFNLASVADVPKDRRIVVYCSVGYRSEKVTEQLRAAGFTNVANLYGGIFEWVNQGHPVVDAEGKPTERVHAYSRSWGVWLRRGKRVY